MSNNTNGWVYGVGQIQVSKGGKEYIRIKKDVVLKKGQSLFLQSFEENLQKMVDRGTITEEEAGRRLDEQSYVKFIINAAPLEDKK